MNRGDMRGLLKRRLAQPAAANTGDWLDSQLNDLLNLSASRLQTVILRLDPDAFLSLVYRDIVAGQKLYLMPDDLLYLACVEIRNSATSAYGTIEPVKYQDTLTPLQGVSTAPPATTVYARFGRKNIALYPTPTTSVASGLQVTACESLTMSDDTTVPSLPLPLHMAIVMRAELYANGETHENSKDIKADLMELLAEIPTWYRRDIAEPQTIDIDLGKQYLDYGTGTGARTWPAGSGFDSRG